MKNLVNYDDLSLVEVPGKGRGVIANRDFAAREIVCTSPVVVIPLSETASLFSTILAKYVFSWPFDANGGKITVKTPEQCAMVIGLGSMVNHEETPNCDWDFIPEAKLHLLRASRYITAGEELSIDYGWTPEEMNGADPVSTLHKLEQMSVMALANLGKEVAAAKRQHLHMYIKEKKWPDSKWSYHMTLDNRDDANVEKDEYKREHHVKIVRGKNRSMKDVNENWPQDPA